MTEGTQDAGRDAVETNASASDAATAAGPPAVSPAAVNGAADVQDSAVTASAAAPAAKTGARKAGARKSGASKAGAKAKAAKAETGEADAAKDAAKTEAGKTEAAASGSVATPPPAAAVVETNVSPAVPSAPAAEVTPAAAPAVESASSARAAEPEVVLSPQVAPVAAVSEPVAPVVPTVSEAAPVIDNSNATQSRDVESRALENAEADTGNATVDNANGAGNANMQRGQNPLEGAPVVEGNMGDNRQVRGGLRFRGREGRVEARRPGNVPGGGDNRNFRGRDGRRGDGDSNGHGGHSQGNRQGRLAQQGRDGNNRDGGNRDNRDGGNRDFANQEGLPRETADAARGRNDFDLTSLEDMNLPELREIAKEFAINASTGMKKNDLVFRILEAQAATSGNLFKKGHLEILPDGKGFLRTEGYLPGNEDVYVSQSQIKRFNLKTGDMVSGQVRAPKEMERYYGLLRVEAINGEAPEAMRTRKEFEKLTPVFPDEKFALETTQENITARIIDLVTPIGKGQRGLIVAPPKAGKTSLIKNIANSIMANHPDVYLIVLLIDERPEEVTDISRSVKGEVVASTFDELPDNHIRVADMVLEKAKRLVEMKRDVVILLDSITRLSRASNLVVTPSGRTMSGGLDPAAMYKPKRLFGAARNIEEGGSLTILATVLVDTGSRMDEYIFEELKGTGNLDLVLDRSLFDMRIFPSIDINKSGTRRDDLLLSKEDLAGVIHLRRTLSALDNDKAITLLIDRLKNTKTNADFMQIVQKSSRNAPA